MTLNDTVPRDWGALCIVSLSLPVSFGIASSQAIAAGAFASDVTEAKRHVEHAVGKVVRTGAAPMLRAALAGILRRSDGDIASPLAQLRARSRSIPEKKLD